MSTGSDLFLRIRKRTRQEICSALSNNILVKYCLIYYLNSYCLVPYYLPFNFPSAQIMLSMELRLQLAD